jgi:hypothetical protein
VISDIFREYESARAFISPQEVVCRLADIAPAFKTGGLGDQSGSNFLLGTLNQQAGCLVSFSEGNIRRVYNPAALFGYRAAGVKAASGGHFDRVGDFTLQDQTLAAFAGIWHRSHRNQ